MNKRTLDQIVNQHHFNELIFTSSISIAQTCQSITNNAETFNALEKAQLKEKQTQL